MVLTAHAAETLLTARDITPTSQRVEIARILFSREQHLSADQLLAMVNRTGAAVSKATVYNTLGLFARKGLVREVIVDPNKIFYDSNTSEHHHVYDLDSGTLTDVATRQVVIKDLPSLPDGTEIAGIDVVVRVRRKVT